jgi:hypothetical protein
LSTSSIATEAVAFQDEYFTTCLHGREFPEKLIIAQLVKKFPAFLGPKVYHRFYKCPPQVPKRKILPLSRNEPGRPTRSQLFY